MPPGGQKAGCQHIIHSFGRDDLVRLCRSIARVCGIEINTEANWKNIDTPETDLPEDIKLIQTLDYGCVMVIGDSGGKAWYRKDIEGSLQSQTD